MVQSLGKERAELFHAPGAFTGQACNEIMAFADRDTIPSTIVDSNGDERFRTSTTGYLPNDMPAVEHIATMISRLLDIPLEHAEQMQAQRYGVGQEFKPHCDWFRPGSDSHREHCSRSGQRTWTAMVYLNEVEAGGETVFPRLGVTLKPRTGTLLLWNNLSVDGEVNPWTIHHAMPVLEGSKYVITLWFREKSWR